MNKFWGVLSVVVGIPLLVGTMFVITYGGQEWRRFFEPRSQNISREVFEETRSYNQAKLQELAKYRLEYMRADEDDKEIIASTVRLRFADYRTENLPSELQTFMWEINQ